MVVSEWHREKPYVEFDTIGNGKATGRGFGAGRNTKSTSRTQKSQKENALLFSSVTNFLVKLLVLRVLFVGTLYVDSITKKPGTPIYAPQIYRVHRARIGIVGSDSRSAAHAASDGQARRSWLYF
jgi:hypothetical protein